MAAKDTFVRFAAAFLRWSRGDRAHRLTSLMAGLLPDMLSEAARWAVRYSMPLPDSAVDSLPYQLAHYGLPVYAETYAATLARLRVAWTTHATAGAQAMLGTESVAAGLVNPAVVATLADSSFKITADNVTTQYLYGDVGLVYGADASIVYGYQCPYTANIARMIRYFKPARERFTGLEPTP